MEKNRKWLLATPFIFIIVCEICIIICRNMLANFYLFVTLPVVAAGAWWIALRIIAYRNRTIEIQTGDGMNDYEILAREKELYEEALKEKPDDAELEQGLKKTIRKMTSLEDNLSCLKSTLTIIPIESDRLRKAMIYIEHNDFESADESLDGKPVWYRIFLPYMFRRTRAFEFLVKAQLWLLFFSKPENEEQAVRLFEASLYELRTPQALFAYAYFMEKIYMSKESEALYKEALPKFRKMAAKDGKYLECLANALSNLGQLHNNIDQWREAVEEFNGALDIFRKLEAKEPEKYLYPIGIMLTALGNINLRAEDKQKALEQYEEALGIIRKLAEKNPENYRSFIAQALHNIATAHWGVKEYEKSSGEFNEALKIYMELIANEDPVHLQSLASTLNNMGVMHTEMKDDAALEELEAALKLREKLAEISPAQILPHLVDTLNNLSKYYQLNAGDREKSIYYASRASDILLSIRSISPKHVDMLLKNVSAILEENGI